MPHRNKGDHKPPTSNRPIPSNNSNRSSKCGDTTHHEGFTCPTKKYQCKACHKFEYFTSQCFQRKQHSQHKYRWLKPIKYRQMKYMTAQTVTHQMLAPVKIPTVCRWKSNDKEMVHKSSQTHTLNYKHCLSVEATPH